MALSLINFFIFDIKEAQIPLLVADVVIVLGLQQFEARRSEAKEQELKQEQLHKEADKQEQRAQKVMTRQQRKAQEQMLKHATNAGHQSSFAPKQPIQQPDRNKKSR